MKYFSKIFFIEFTFLYNDDNMEKIYSLLQ